MDGTREKGRNSWLSKWILRIHMCKNQDFWDIYVVECSYVFMVYFEVLKCVLLIKEWNGIDSSEFGIIRHWKRNGKVVSSLTTTRRCACRDEVSGAVIWDVSSLYVVVHILCSAVWCMGVTTQWANVITKFPIIHYTQNTHKLFLNVIYIKTLDLFWYLRTKVNIHTTF